MSAPDTQWIRFLRENKYLRDSFFAYLAWMRNDSMEQFPNVKDRVEMWRLQGGVRAIDFITAFCQKELGSLENAGRNQNGKSDRSQD